MNDISEESVYNSEWILFRINRDYENKSSEDSDEYVDEINGREYEVISLTNKSDYDDNFIMGRGIKTDKMED